MSHLNLDHQIRLFVISDSAVFDKVSTAIRHYGRHAQWAMKMFQILSYSVTAFEQLYSCIFNSYLRKGKEEMHLNCFVYFLSACVLMRM